jgi:hypothetical protein
MDYQSTGYLNYTEPSTDESPVVDDSYGDGGELTEQQMSLLSMIESKDDVPIGSLFVLSYHPSCIKAMTDILADQCATAMFKFHPDGLTISHVSKDKKISTGFMIPKNGFIEYDIKICDQYIDSMKKIGYVSARVNLRSATNVLKNYPKEGNLIMRALPQKCGRINQIPCQGLEHGTEYIACDWSDGDEYDCNAVSAVSIHYKGMEPNCRIPLKSFSSILNALKGTGCDTLKFILNDTYIGLMGLKNGSPLGDGYHLSFKGGISVGNGQETAIVHNTSGGARFVLRNYSVTINFSSCKDWMTKISRLTASPTPVLIYMRDDAPVVITVHIGTLLGEAIFSFMDDPRR